MGSLSVKTECASYQQAPEHHDVHEKPTIWFVSQLDGIEVLYCIFGQSGCSNRVGLIVQTAIEAYDNLTVVVCSQGYEWRAKCK